MIDADIDEGRAVLMPEDLLVSMRQILEEVYVDLDEPIEGDVCI
ncbi:hypothetical protein [Azospirillum brasilense]|nr:hypothetical protein [Azospirillum brasilense]